MPLIDILAPDGVIPSARATTKKMLLELIAEQASRVCGLPERLVFETLLQRERLGSTGIGAGIAIPHGKFDGLDRLMGLFIRTEKPLDFESLDGEPVDLLFVLLAPEGAGADHLKGLSRVARMLRNSAITSQLRQTRDAEAIFVLLTQPAETSKAA